MTLATYLSFLAGAFALVASPGPDFIFALSRGLAHGWRGGVLAALGIALGLITHTTVALLGLAALFAASPLAYNILKYLGVAFLIYLSIRMLAGRDLRMPAEKSGAVHARPPVGKILRQGYTVNVLNPGPLITFSAYLPQFIPADAPDHNRLFVLLAASLIATAFCWFSISGSFAGAFTEALQKRVWLQRAMRLGFGGLLLGLAVMLALRHSV